MDYANKNAWAEWFSDPRNHGFYPNNCECNPPVCKPVPPPPCPPVPGKSPMECMNELYSQLCSTMKECTELNCKTSEIMRDLKEYGLRNGAYYDKDVICIQDGYNADENAPYKVIIVTSVKIMQMTK